ncbi:MAG: peptide-methionine (S)-S-oxide reductase MsrA [Kofleriaceae bacterium]
MLRLVYASIVVVALGGCGQSGSPRSEPGARPVPAAAGEVSPGGVTAPPPGGASLPRVTPIAPTVGPGLEVALLAGGCFWGMEELLRAVDGVVDTEVGYVGGEPATATYAQVHLGTTGHAESVKVVFDPARLSYADLLERWFFRMHDPTTRDRQGNDRGSQYRSAIFYTTEGQRVVAAEVVARVDGSGRWSSPLVTSIEPAGVFTAAEAEHQDYLQQHPDGYTCHYLRD